MTEPASMRWTGGALVLAGVMVFGINAVLTPMLPEDASFAESASSWVFLWRQALSAITAALLLLGTIGVQLRQADRSGAFGTVAFVAALVGSGLLLAQEWNQVFLVRDLAERAPDVLDGMDGGEGFSLADIGALAAFAVFSLGWLALAASALRSGAFWPVAPGLVLAGFFATPILGGVLPGVIGVIVGNGILGAGWVLMGREVLVGVER